MKRLKLLSIVLAFLLLISYVSFIGLAVNDGDDLYSVQMEVEFKQTEARKLLDMINELRLGSDAWYWKYGDTEKEYLTDLKAVTYDYGLEKVAMQRAAEIALFYDHTRPNNTYFFSAYPEPYHTDSFAGENIAFGQTSAKAVNYAWREDRYGYWNQGHRRNMLTPGYGAVGVGCVLLNGIYYWVEEFSYKAHDSAFIDPIDCVDSVTIEIAEKNFEISSFEVSPSSYSLETNQRVFLPDLTIFAKTPKLSDDKDRALCVNATWSVDNTDIALVKSEKIIGKNAGNTQINTRIKDMDISVPVSICKGASEYIEDPEVEPTTQPSDITETSEQNNSQTDSSQPSTTITGIPHIDVDNNGLCDNCNGQMLGGNHCEYCGKIHTGIFAVFIKTYHYLKDRIMCSLFGYREAYKNYRDTYDANNCSGNRNY